MGQALETIDALEQIERAHAEARAEESRAQSRLRQLAPYRELSEPLEKLGRSRLDHEHAGRGGPAARGRAERGHTGGKRGWPAGFDVVSIDKDGAHIFVLSPLDEVGRVLGAAQGIGFHSGELRGLYRHAAREHDCAGKGAWTNCAPAMLNSTTRRADCATSCRGSSCCTTCWSFGARPR